MFCNTAGIAARLFPQGFLLTLHPDRLAHLANTTPPDVAGLDRGGAWRERSVFVVSMGDLFGKWVPAWYVEAVLDRIGRHPQWFCFVLTKHPGRLGEFSFPGNAAVGLTLTGDEPHGAAPHDASARAALYAQYAGELGRVRGAAFTWLSAEPLRGDVGDLSPFSTPGSGWWPSGARAGRCSSGPTGPPCARRPGSRSWPGSSRSGGRSGPPGPPCSRRRT